MLPSQSTCQRVYETHASTVLFVISSVAPPIPRFEEPVDVLRQYAAGMATSYSVRRSLTNLVGVQARRALWSPTSCAVALQASHLSARSF